MIFRTPGCPYYMDVQPDDFTQYQWRDHFPLLKIAQFLGKCANSKPKHSMRALKNIPENPYKRQFSKTLHTNIVLSKKLMLIWEYHNTTLTLLQLRRKVQIFLALMTICENGRGGKPLLAFWQAFLLLWLGYELRSTIPGRHWGYILSVFSTLQLYFSFYNTKNVKQSLKFGYFVSSIFLQLVTLHVVELKHRWMLSFLANLLGKLLVFLFFIFSKNKLPGKLFFESQCPLFKYVNDLCVWTMCAAAVSQTKMMLFHHLTLV